MEPLISIVIPLYNKQKHIKKTIFSVLDQTFSDFEIIVINDGSTDNSLKVLDTIEDKRLNVFSTINQGVSKARNFGISKAAGKFIAFLDADDIWFKHHLEDLKKLQEQFPDCGLYCKAYLKKEGNLDIPSRYNSIPNNKPWKGIVEDYFKASKINNIAWTSSVMIPKSILEDFNGFDEKITLGAGEDTDLWIRIALNYKVAFSNNVSAIHMLDSDNRISNSNTNLRRFIDLDKYEEEAKNNSSLKTYLDLNRYSFAIQYKLVKNTLKANEYIDKINPNSLNKKQLFLLKQHPTILKLIFGMSQILKKFNIKLSSF